MAKVSSLQTQFETSPPPADRPVPPEQARADRWVSELSTLLRELESVTGDVSQPVVDQGIDDRLIQVRLGAAGGLFAALRCKHALTAGHALRVALSCSAWAMRMGIKESLRDALEIAALLHDVGVIGVPDHILLKPGSLTAEEAAVVSQSRRMSLEILRHSCSAPEVLDIVEFVPAWYDGSRDGFRLLGTEIPLGSRMIAIVEAFDAMTTDHVYRPAMSQERARMELFDCAGTRFDPELVKRFAEFHVGDSSELHREVAGRWLTTLVPEMVDSYWQLSSPPPQTRQEDGGFLFQKKLLANMYDAVVFIDTAGRVTLWNRGAERLTGIAGSSVHQHPWQPELLEMSDEKGLPVVDNDCPVHGAIRSGVQSLRRLTIRGRNERPVAVDTHAIPVVGEDGVALGAILLFHDASSETSLEHRCQSLHEKATKDPMTQVANRAEFDRVHEMFVAAHQQQQLPCSLMICDLDRFKQVNDTYGHQSGDDVIKSLAALLKALCRPGDLVARYGGEEFVVLCADCDNATATQRAEGVRRALAQIPQRRMGGRTATVSFGVTEIQPGDTPETMLRRADRALLMAKANGRNTVVQLGTGTVDRGAKKTKRTKPGKKTGGGEALEQTVVTPVPVKMAVEKLRGFVADHQAKIVKIDGDRVELEIFEQPGPMRRRTDRPIVFRVELCFQEERFQKSQQAELSAGVSRTRIQVSIQAKKNRDRRREDLSARARDVLISFQSYLMAATETEESVPTTGTLTKARRILAPWLARK